MATTINFKQIIDLPEWRPLAQTLNNHVAGNSYAFDLRKDDTRDPCIFHHFSQSILGIYNTITDGWDQTPSFTSVGGTAGAGAGSIFVPSASRIYGAVAGSPTTTSFTLATLPYTTSVVANQFAQKGDGLGYYVRVIGSAAGSSGKTEVRRIVANTAGTTPIIYLDSALSFTPLVGDNYEFLSGAIFIVGSGTVAAGYWKKFDRALKTISGNLNVTNLANTGTNTTIISLDEQYVPASRNNGDGFFDNGSTYNGGNSKCIVASAAAGTTITANLAASGISADEYKNFQIRIVEDTGTPTAVGQRRKITTHGAAGAATAFTVATWTVTPSATAKFVVEYANDIVLWTSGQTVTYSYAAGFGADANWSTQAAAGGATQFANPGVGMGQVGDVVGQCFSIDPDVAHATRHSHIYFIKGGTATPYRFDIAANSWSSAFTIDTPGNPLSTGSCYAQDPAMNNGRYLYCNISSTPRHYRIDLLTNRIDAFTQLPVVDGSALTSRRMAWACFKDGTIYVSKIFRGGDSNANFFDIIPPVSV